MATIHIRVTVEGIEDAKRAFRKVIDAAGGAVLERAVHAGAVEIRDEARRLSPGPVTGALRSNIRIEGE